MRRLVIESDYHCGHWTGLTPPEYYQAGKKGRQQKEVWEFRQQILKALKPIDFLVLNGDGIEGKGPRSGGTELVTSDRKEQAQMAADCIDAIGANEVGLTYGTPAHTGMEEDWEDVIAGLCKTPVAFMSGQEFLEFEGIWFDFKHKVGGSSIPHGRGTSIAKDKLWNMIHAAKAEQPDAQVTIRSHLHYGYDVGDPDWRGIITPAWQGYGSKFGERQCSGTIRIGLICFDVEDGEYSWDYHTAKGLEQQKASITRR